MKTFKSEQEIESYYNKNTNIYDFVENGNRIDVKFEFALNCSRDIKAGDITAWNISAWNITAVDINAGDINARDIKARDIKAGDISYYAVCFTYSKFICKSVVGRRASAKHFCLDSEIELIKTNKETDELSESIKRMKEEIAVMEIKLSEYNK